MRSQTTNKKDKGLDSIDKRPDEDNGENGFLGW